MNDMANPAAAVNISNWRQRPYNRWSFRNADKVMPTAPVDADPAAAAPLERSRKTARSLLLNGMVLGSRLIQVHHMTTAASATAEA